jgi:hypothetical protein
MGTTASLQCTLATRADSLPIADTDTSRCLRPALERRGTGMVGGLTIFARASLPAVAPRSRPSATAGDTADGWHFRREGEYWTIVYAAQVIRIRDAVGLHHLAQLLWHPRREFRAVDLMRALAMAGACRRGAPARRGTPHLDARATSEYRQRIRDLRDELDESEARNDPWRSERLRHEMEAIVRELRNGARGRQLDVDVERARIAVTKTLKAVIGRIHSAHPELGEHLEATIKRGHVCIYRPDPRSPIHWTS